MWLSSTSPTNANQRELRFSIRSLLVVVTLIAICLAWSVYPVLRQRRAASFVERLGGYVVYDYQFSNDGRFQRTPNTIVPAWMRKLLGDDWFSRIRVVFDDTHATDDDLERIMHLADLRELQLDKTNVTDAGMRHLKDSRQLICVAITNTPVTDAGFRELKQLPNLRELWIDGTTITDEGIDELKRALPTCEVYRDEPTISVQ